MNVRTVVGFRSRSIAQHLDSVVHQKEMPPVLAIPPEAEPPPAAPALDDLAGWLQHLRRWVRTCSTTRGSSIVASRRIRFPQTWT